MNEQSIAKLYEILGHNGYYTRMGSLDCTSGKYENVRVFGLEAVLDYARTWNSRRNVFIARNPRSVCGDVISSFCITFDIDPRREKGLAADDKQHDSALNAGRRILETYPDGYLCSSGNGCLLLYPIPDGFSNLELYYRQEKVFIERLNKMVEGLNVKIDTTSYQEAVIKCLGTESTKGDVQYHRLSRFITYPNVSHSGNSIYNVIRQIEVNTPSQNLEKFEGDPVERIQTAKDCLDKLGEEFYDDYRKWTEVGMSLKEFGISGLSLWKEWSRKGKTYKEGECEEKWKSFNETPDITLGSLRLWAGSINSRTSISSSNENYFNELFSEDSRLEKPILTGIGRLDSVLRSLPKGEITTIAARSGFGKSSFACTASEFLRREGKRVLYFSTEMSREYILHKFVSIACNIETQKLIQKDISEEESKRIREYEKEFSINPIILCDEFSPKIELVKDLINQYKPDVLVFDHATQSGTHWEYVAQFVRGLKEITAQTGLVTILASQLNEPPRGTKGDIGPSVRGDIRGSQEIIFLSAIFMMMNNIYETKTEIQPVELEICKNRFGVSGIKLEIHCNKLTGKYTD